MAIQQYNTVTPRIDKVAGKMLAHAIPKEVLSVTGNQHRMPRNKSDTIIFRRWLPTGGSSSGSQSDPGSTQNINRWNITAAAHLTSEGVTPVADTINAQDITVVLNQYSCLYMYTDKVAELYEDNVPDGQIKLTGERMGLVRELIRYGALKGCTNKFYSGGTTRATVDEPVSLNLLRKMTRSLTANRADPITSVLSASPNFSTQPVESGYLVFCHSDAEHDIRELPGFTPCAEYGSRQMVHPMERGSCENFRFIVSPELASIPDSGKAIGSDGLFSTSGVNNDVYPFIVVGEEAWGDVALRGRDSFMPVHIPHTMESKEDPLKQRGYVGSKFYSAAFVQNDGWMAVAECGITDL